MAAEDAYIEAGAQLGAFRALFGRAFEGVDGDPCTIVHNPIRRFCFHESLYRVRFPIGISRIEAKYAMGTNAPARHHAEK